MPKKYPPLSAEEKQAILQRHQELVDKINADLPDEMKIAYDPHLKDRLEDEKEVEVYRIGQEMAERRRKQDEIINNLKAQFGAHPDSNNAFGRSLVYGMRVEDTPEAREFNEKMYRDYLENQGQLAYIRFKDVLSFDPQKLYDCGEDRVKLAEFYRDNPQLCDDGFVVNSCLSRLPVPKQLQDSISKIARPIEALHYPSTIVQSACDIDYFACPQMRPEVAIIAFGNKDLEVPKNEGLRLSLLEMIGQNTVENSYQFLNHFKEHGLEFGKDAFVRYKGERTDPQTGEKTEIGIGDAFAQMANDSNVKVVERSKEEIQQLKFISKSFQNEYAQIWQQKFAEKTGKENFNIAAYEKENKGGVMERFVFFSTSKEYKNLKQTFREYNDPNSPNYMRKDKLRKAADGYLDHCQKKGYSSLSEMKGTRLGRATFATNIIEHLDQMEKDDAKICGQIENKFLQGYDRELLNGGSEPAQENIKEIEEFQNQVKLDLNEELVQSEVKVASSDAPTKQMEIEEEILNEK